MTIEDTGTAPMDSGATEDLRSDTTTAPSEAPSSEAPAETNTEAANDAELHAIWDKRNPTRDEGGRFQSKNPSEPGEEAEAPESTEGQPPAEDSVEQAAKPAIEPPMSWPKEMKDKWGTLPPDAQEYIARRESEAHSKISQMGNETAALRPVAHVIEQNRDVFSKHGVNPDQGIQLLVTAQRRLDENPVAAIAELARSYGVDLSVFANGRPSTQSPETAMLQDQIARLQSQLEQTNGYVRSQQEAEHTARANQHLATIDTFLAGKTISESDIDELAVLIETERRLDPGKTPDKLLEAAYETFQGRKPERREALIAQRVKQEAESNKATAEKKAAEARKLGSLNVRSSPGASSSNRSMDDTLADIARRAYSNR